MSKFFCFFIWVSICVNLRAAESKSQEQEILKIEQSIEALIKEKNSYQKKIKLHQDKGGLWQFDKDNFLESRMEYFLAGQEKDKIQLIELKIQNLEELKKEILGE